MKIMKTLSTLVGSSVLAAGVLASASPAHAISTTWTFSNTSFSISGTTFDVTGSFAYDDSNLGSSVNTSSSSVSILNPQNGTTIVSFGNGSVNSLATAITFTTTANNTTYNLATNFSNQLTSATTATVVAAGTVTDTISSGSSFSATSSNGVGGTNIINSTNFVGAVTAAGTGTSSGGSTGVPFEVPGGATIPVFGSILALGAMRKFKTSFANSVR
jgi:hypothetical protein